jgi:predicted dehydrogenase
VPTPLPITDRPVRVAVAGLGQIAELCLPPYETRADVEIVGLCDLDPARIEPWARRFPTAATTTDLAELLRLDADVIDVLVPTPYHCAVVTQCLDAGFHVQVQKPIARSREDADAMLAAAQREGAQLRILEDYLVYPPLVQLRDIVAAGELGTPSAVHMKIVGTGRGGWDVPESSFRWQWEQARDGRGMLVFDHGWHQLAIAHWLFGPITRIFAWIGSTQVAPDIAPEIVLDAPSTLVWEHENGVRGVMDVTIAPDTYFRSDYYTCDERIEVTAARGYVRCNRVSACGVQEPSVVVYTEGQTRGFHALPDSPPDAFAAQTQNLVDVFTGSGATPVMDGADARAVLEALLTALDSARAGRPLDVPPT